MSNFGHESGRHVNKMEKVQQRATKMINVLEKANTVAERMMKWELFSLKER